ncbi:hypothetical protein AAY473_000258 [Plecturocebus cupreus]
MADPRRSQQARDGEDGHQIGNSQELQKKGTSRPQPAAQPSPSTDLRTRGDHLHQSRTGTLVFTVSAWMPRTSGIEVPSGQGRATFSPSTGRFTDDLSSDFAALDFPPGLATRTAFLLLLLRHQAMERSSNIPGSSWSGWHSHFIKSHNNPIRHGSKPSFKDKEPETQRDGVLHCCPGWSAMVRSRLTAASISWVQKSGFTMLARLVSNSYLMICLPRPPKVLGLQQTRCGKEEDNREFQGVLILDARRTQGHCPPRLSPAGGRMPGSASQPILKGQDCHGEGEGGASQLGKWRCHSILPRLEGSGMITAHCSLDLLGSSHPPTLAS